MEDAGVHGIRESDEMGMVIFEEAWPVGVSHPTASVVVLFPYYSNAMSGGNCATGGRMSFEK
jgi:hypothetical protein